MLNPQDRLTLAETLTPPRGFTLDHAVGTTFTLDLESALSVPLALAAKRVESNDDQLSILDALRRTEQHVDIFAQAGQISMGTPSSLVTLLERSVHQVAQQRGLFHPKVWFLRFTDGEDTRYRFVCSSRNLTQDRSWDVVVQLDGERGDLDDVRQLRAQNRPLAGMLRRLPTMTIHDFDAKRRDRVDALADEWEGIEWELPEGVRELRFHALGPGGGPAPEMEAVRKLIVSPFLSDDGIRLLRGGTRRETHVISRPEALERLHPDSLDRKLHTYVLDDAAHLDSDDVERNPESVREPLNGLHAKVVVHDRSDRSARVLLGSANATEAAWSTNTEVMVEVIGSSSQLGVHRTLEELGDLKEEFETTGGEEATEQEETEYRLERHLRAIAAVPVFMRLSGSGPCDVTVWSAGAVADEPGVTLSWQPLQAVHPIEGGIPTHEQHARVIEAVPLEQITPFIIVTARQGGIVRRTVLLAHMYGDFERRRTAALTSHISNKASFLRLLTMMLDLAGFGQTFSADGDGAFGAFTSATGDSAGLMEALAKALGHGTDAIADVERIVDFISSDERRAAEVLPDGFEQLWAAVRAAYKTTQRGSS